MKGIIKREMIRHTCPDRFSMNADLCCSQAVTGQTNQHNAHRSGMFVNIHILMEAFLEVNADA